VAPVVVIIERNKIDGSGSVTFFDLPEEMFGMQSDLMLRSPEVRQPKAEEEGGDSTGDETVLKGREHNFLS